MNEVTLRRAQLVDLLGYVGDHLRGFTVLVFDQATYRLSLAISPWIDVMNTW